MSESDDNIPEIFREFKDIRDLTNVDPLKIGRYGQFDFAAFLKTETLPPDDPEEALLQDDVPIWTDDFKLILLNEIESSEIDLFDPGDLMQYLPLYKEPWEAKHKALAILVMRILMGENWQDRMRWRVDNCDPVTKRLRTR